MTSTDMAAGSQQSQAGGGPAPKEMATAAIQAVKDEAKSFAATAQDKVGDQVEQGKQTATKAMGDFANAIRKAGDELSQSDQSMAAKMVRQAADGLESFSRSVTDKRPEELLDAVRDFGRENPAAFIAGSVLLGLAIGRFARSSQQHSQAPSGADAQAMGSGGALGRPALGEGYRSPSDFVSSGPDSSPGTDAGAGLAGGGAEDAGDPAGATFGMTGAESPAAGDPSRSRFTPEG